MFQVVQREHRTALSHKADLLATLAELRNGDASAVQDSSEDPWQSDDCNLLALADASGKIVALNTTTSDFPVAAAQAMLRRSLSERKTAGWWYSGERLYQVVLQPIYSEKTRNKAPIATVVVGRELAFTANDWGCSSCATWLRWGIAEEDDVGNGLAATDHEALVIGGPCKAANLLGCEIRDWAGFRAVEWLQPDIIDTSIKFFNDTVVANRLADEWIEVHHFPWILECAIR
jgi:hypothetical protein